MPISAQPLQSQSDAWSNIREEIACLEKRLHELTAAKSDLETALAQSETNAEALAQFLHELVHSTNKDEPSPLRLTPAKRIVSILPDAKPIGQTPLVVRADQAKDVMKVSDDNSTEAEFILKSAKDEATRHASEIEERAERQYGERRSQFENEMAALRAKCEDDQRKWTAERQGEWQSRKNADVQLITERLRSMISDYFEVTPGVKLEAEEMTKLLAQVDAIVRRIMQDNSPAAEQTVKQRYRFNPETMRDVRRDRIRAVLGTGAVTIVILAFSLYPELRRPFTKLMTMKDTAPDKYVSQVLEERRKNLTYEPAQTPGFKETYTDNVLFTQDFLKLEQDDEYKKQWILDANHFFTRELELSDKVVAQIVPLERVLIRRLVGMKNEIIPEFEQNGIRKMREAEMESRPQFEAILGGQVGYQRFIEHKRAFFSTYMAQLPGK